MIHKIGKLIIVLFLMIVIFSFSMDSGSVSTNRSNSFAFSVGKMILRRELTEEEKNFYWDTLEVPVRKTAHFTIYFLLGLSYIWFLKEFDSFSWKTVLYAILFVFLYACSDEIHQLFVSERSGEILDVFIDTIGGSVGILFYYYFKKRRMKYEQKKAVS